MMQEKEKMLSRVIAAVALVGASLLVASSASAFDCSADERKSISLDWKRGMDKRPLPSLDLRVVAETCVDKLKADSFYFEAFSARFFSSKIDVEAEIAAVRAYMEIMKRYDPAELKKMVAFIEKSDKEANATVADAKK